MVENPFLQPNFFVFEDNCMKFSVLTADIHLYGVFYNQVSAMNLDMIIILSKRSIFCFFSTASCVELLLFS